MFCELVVIFFDKWAGLCYWKNAWESNGRTYYS